MSSALDLAKRLIACESVTPATGAVFDALEAMLEPLGFAVTRFTAGEDAPAGPVENLYAVRGTGARHFAFAGHLDVVPAGKGWTGDAFEPEERGGLLYGRGAVDMKGAIAAFVAALADVPEDAGRISLIITGDEEGDAVDQKGDEHEQSGDAAHRCRHRAKSPRRENDERAKPPRRRPQNRHSRTILYRPAEH